MFSIHCNEFSITLALNESVHVIICKLRKWMPKAISMQILRPMSNKKSPWTGGAIENCSGCRSLNPQSAQKGDFPRVELLTLIRYGRHCVQSHSKVIINLMTNGEWSSQQPPFCACPCSCISRSCADDRHESFVVTARKSSPEVKPEYLLAGYCMEMNRFPIYPGKVVWSNLFKALKVEIWLAIA